MATPSYKQRARRERALLRLALTEEYHFYRKELKQIFALLDKLGYGVRGYRRPLESAIKYADRTVAAADVLEGRNESAQK